MCLQLSRCTRCTCCSSRDSSKTPAWVCASDQGIPSSEVTNAARRPGPQSIVHGLVHRARSVPQHADPANFKIASDEIVLPEIPRTLTDSRKNRKDCCVNCRHWKLLKSEPWPTSSTPHGNGRSSSVRSLTTTLWATGWGKRQCRPPLSEASGGSALRPAQARADLTPSPILEIPLIKGGGHLQTYQIKLVRLRNWGPEDRGQNALCGVEADLQPMHSHRVWTLIWAWLLHAVSHKAKTIRQVPL